MILVALALLNKKPLTKLMKGNINLMSSQVIIFILMASGLYYNESAFLPSVFGSRVDR